MRYSTLIFDLDGTLVDSYEALGNSINFARVELGFAELPVEVITSFVGEGLEKLLERSFHPSPVPADARAIFERKYDEVCCTQSRVLDGVKETVVRLHELGATMAICTNKGTSFSRKIVDYVGLGRFMAAVVGPDLAGARKPDGRHVEFALQAANGDKPHALFVGDMLVDVEAARNAGIAVAVIATGATSADVLRAAGAEHVLNRFDDLLGIVQGDEA